jgi:aspartate 1-decarboxylase
LTCKKDPAFYRDCGSASGFVSATWVTVGVQSHLCQAVEVVNILNLRTKSVQSCVVGQFSNVNPAVLLNFSGNSQKRTVVLFWDFRVRSKPGAVGSILASPFGVPCQSTIKSPMQRIMLRAKIHRATVTQCDLHYEGSCGIDENLLEAADIREFEKIELYDVNNGERFSTYAIRGKRGSGEISLNGAAARRAHLGDLLIICTYAPMDEAEAEKYQPKIVFVDDKNQITGLKKSQ